MKQSWLQRHPLQGLFILAFGVSWGLILVIMASRGFDLRPLQAVEGGLLFFAMLLGPSVSGVVCTALLDGHTGLSRLGRNLR